MSRGNFTADQIRDDNKHGNAALLQMSDGTGAAGNFAKYDANGNLVDGGTSSGAPGQGFNFRGAWAASTAYAAYDVVTYGGQTYECSTAFTSGSSFNPANWNLWAAQGATGSAGAAGATGAAGAAGAAGQGFNFRGAWAASTAYAAYDVVTYGGQTYECSTAFTSGSSFNPANWNLWAQKGDPGTAAGVATKTASYTAVSGDAGKLLVFNSGGALTLTLPATPPSATWNIAVQNIGAGTLTISPNGLQLDGASGSLSVPLANGAVIYTDGTNYFTQRGISFAGAGSLMTYTGNYSSIASYAVGNVALYNGKLYLRQVASGGTVNAVLRNTSAQLLTGSSVSVSLPSGSVAGDLCFIFAGCPNGATTPPTGWTTAASTGSLAFWNGIVVYKVLTSGDVSAGSVTFGLAGSGVNVFAAATFVGGTGGVREVDYANSTSSTASSIATLATSSSVAATDFLLYFGSNKASGLDTVNRGTKQQQLTDGSIAAGCLYSEAMTASGAISPTFNYPGTYNPSGNYEAIAVIMGAASSGTPDVDTGDWIPFGVSAADLALKAPLDSPALTGTPTAPTPATSDNSTKVATTAYVKAQGSGGASPLTTKGDLYGYSTASARIPVGTDGQVLTADSTQALGLKWGAATSGGSSSALLTRTVQGPRVFGTVYQNTSSYPMIVTVGDSASSSGIVAYTDSSSTPTTVVWTMVSYTSAAVAPALFIVMPGNYYKVTGTTLSYWSEYLFSSAALTASGNLSGSRSLGSVYHNTGSGVMLVQVAVTGASSGAIITVKSDSATTPTSVVYYNPTGSSTLSAFFLVLAGDYYSVACTSGSIAAWNEYSSGIAATRTNMIQSGYPTQRALSAASINASAKTNFLSVGYPSAPSSGTLSIYSDKNIAPILKIWGLSALNTVNRCAVGFCPPGEVVNASQDTSAGTLAFWWEYQLG